jgi:2,2-dialkylglycine decarboxylase (pyruvate)
MATASKDIVIERASGCTFVDVDGNEYLDLSSGQICALVGHGHPKLVARIVEQLQRVMHTGTSFMSPVVLEAAGRLATVAPPGLTRSLLLSTGAEANEFALKLAKAATGRSGVLAMTRGYAGLTLATSALTNYGRGAHPEVPGVGHILTPDSTECPAGREPLEWARELLAHSLEAQRGKLEDVAAIMVEPILSAGGMIVVPDGYLRELRKLADSLGALLIADEAQTGMGRTGKWFGVNHDEVVPDILVLSKGVGGGFPVAAVVTTVELSDRAMGRATQFSSHQSDPVPAAALVAVIDIIEEEGLVARAAETGAYMMNALRQVAAVRPGLIHVRGRGLMVGFDVVRDPGRPKAEREVGEGIEQFCVSRGVNFQAIQKNRFRILPPLTISRAEVDRFVAVLDEALGAMERGQLPARQALNARTVAYLTKQTGERRRLRRVAQWAWNHSPRDWFARIRK